MSVSISRLEARLERIDLLVDTILNCESFLDEFFPSQESPPCLPNIPTPLNRNETDIARSCADRIRREREARGWRQQDLADITGIARPNIARLESGKRMPKISTLQKIAEAFGLRMEEMMD